MQRAAALVALAGLGSSTAAAAPKASPAVPKASPAAPKDAPAPAKDVGAPAKDASGTPDAGPPPWSQGVPAEQQARANAIYEEGNQLFAQQSHAPALEKYREAIALWDHPLIRFNMAVTEIRLDRILEAAEDLEKALRFGARPFKPELFQQAQDYEALVKGRVGYVEATCTQPGARVLLDGKPWFDCAGSGRLRVLAGEHLIVGEHQGFMTSSIKVVVAGDQTVSRKVELLPLDAAVRLEYPHRRWLPWATVGAGAAIAVAGLGTWMLGRSGMDQFEADFAVQCADGCEPGLGDPAHRSLLAESESAQLKGKIGLALLGAGGAVAAAGAVFAILNRPRRVLPAVEVEPTGGGARMTVGWRF